MKGISITLGIAVLILGAGTAWSEEFIVSIPLQKWAISIDAPPLQKFRGIVEGKDFQFQGIAQDGFNISVFVEQPKTQGKNHEACFKHYWPLAKKNPMIDKESITITKTDAYVKVSYQYKMKKIIQPNVNYYFSYQNRWVDVHISKLPFDRADERIFEAFEKHLSYKETK